MTLYYCECCEQFSMAEPHPVQDLIGNDPYPMYQYHEACPMCGEWGTYEEYGVQEALQALDVMHERPGSLEALSCYVQLTEYLLNH